MEQINVLLINPRASAHWDRRIPFGLAYLAAVIRDRYRTRIVDMAAENMTDKELLDIIKKDGYNVVGITGMTHQIMNAYTLTKLIKKNTSSIVILGGCHTYFCPDEALDSGSDFVIIGEGEETLTELLEAFAKDKREYSDIKGLAFKGEKGEIVITQKRELLPDINVIPPPARDMLPIAKYTDAGFFGRPALEFMFGRGCPHNCIFCSSPALWERRVRMFTLDRIMDEITECTRRYRNRYIFITDDVFTVRRKFVMDFCARVKDMRLRWWCISRVDMVDREMLLEMKRSGCAGISYGVESGDQAILDFENKGITINRIKETFRLHREIGLPAKALMIIGHPLETTETIRQSMELAKELDSFGYVCAQMMCPYIGTALYDSIAKDTGKITTYNWDDYVTWKFPPIFVPKDLDAETVYNAAREMSLIKGTTFRDYVMAFNIARFEIFNWNFFFRPILSNSLKKLLPVFVTDWIRNMRDRVLKK
ncbi:MAG: B12-binding domain-containing radical SAM protein [Candidatus Omnitrophica bacterium]|nr:B12-binding domain-containing radical SAM protein [Candidatus Omnitrophota bacterium]